MRRSPKQNADRGLSLIEVIVAIALIGLVAASAATFFISGVSTTSDLQRKQAAVTLANNAMDQARSVTPGAVAGGSSGLVRGRTEAAVTAAWNAATSAEPNDTADMNAAWDTSITTGDPDDQWVPLTVTRTVSSQTYTIDTLIGTCYRPKAASTTSDDCVKTNPDPSADTHVMLYRVRVVVRWAESATATPQTYRLTSLADPSTDTVWNTVLKPFAYDDEITVTAGDGPEFFAIVANDQVEYNTEGGVSPVEDLTQPAHGSVHVDVNAGINGVVFTPPTGDDTKTPPTGDDTKLAGTVTFTYAVRGTSLEKSAPATVTVHILPKPVDDKVVVPIGSNTVLNDTLLANDLGTQNIDPDRTVSFVLAANPDVDLFTEDEVPQETEDARIASAQKLAQLGVSMNAAGEVRYQEPGVEDPGPIEFYYYLVDENPSAPDQRYPSVEPAKVTIEAGACVNVNDLAVNITADQRGEFIDLGINEKNGNDPGCLIDIVQVDYTPLSQRGEIQVGSNNYNATDNRRATKIGYKFQDDIPFRFTITYRMYGPDGTSTTGVTGVITVTVLPVAHDDSYTIGRGQELRPANSPHQKLRANDWPPNGGQVLIRIETPPTCGSFTQGLTSSGDFSYLNDDGIVFKAPDTAGNCTFTYRLVGPSPDLSDVTSDVATVTITVE